ncbi:MAG: 50S ribosomal protein L6 [Ruminococcaceae bacterium]|nr:50S ribosomal protein L6 [Oscillospiraceae bacterium]
MSRIGRMPVAIPAGVKVTLDGNVIKVKGPKGELTQALHSDMAINVTEKEITVTRPSEEKVHKSLHGLTRTLIYNMVVGVTEGYKKELEINGVGYRAQKSGKNVVLNLGFSHDVVIPEIAGITVDVPDPNHLVVSGADKQQVGQVAAEIRSKRPPEPYLGKGIKYTTETIRRKSGKAGK